GLLAGLDGVAFLTGDASLRKRPMRRVIEPLTRMGCQFEATGGDRMPLMIRGAEQVLAIDYQLPVASAQVKSAVLLAGLYARSTTRILESVPTRDHSERMLAAMGCDIKSQPYQGGRELILTPPGRLQACDFTVPGDPSSAAFVIVAALIVPASQITLPNLCLNPTRTGLLQSLQEMGANIESQSPTEQSGEPTGLLTVQSSALKGGVVIPASRTASMIDEYPILAIAAAFAHGTTCMEGIAELRFKESDRLAAIVDGLRANSVPVRAGDDWLEVDGSAGKPIPGGGFVETRLDHRIAMSFLVLGLYANQPVTIDDAHAITTSFPNFIQSIRKLGGNID
ncbi:MAG: 3-phosphoshikimate 1-carboxyvinyltransferase, partial [Pseudomonadota bacterium]